MNFRKLFIALLALTLCVGFVNATEVTFMVNMSFQQDLGNFDPETDGVVIRGGFNNWEGNDYLLAVIDEETAQYGGFGEFEPGSYEGETGFKFVIIHTEGDDSWENIDNRSMVVGDEPMTYGPVWFNNQEPVETTDVEILFQVDMSVAMAGGNFDPAADGIVIRGGHAAIGDWGGFTILDRVGASDIYAAWIMFDALPVGMALEYKFVIDDDNDQADPVQWEELAMGGNRMVTPSGEEGDIDENGYGEISLEPVYFADNPGNIESDATVHFHLDTHPAYAKFADVGIDGVDAIDGFWIAGLGELVGWNWGGLPDEARLWDDGNMPDETADDMIYALDVVFPAGSPRMQIYKYGVNMLDNEAGFGENHVIIMDADLVEGEVWDIFGENGSMYDDYMSVREIETPMTPSTFSVEQNYPNPFNPVTTIAFNLNEKLEVFVKVFNLTGQQVFSHDAGALNAGRYEITFQAGSLSNGVYIYQVNAGGQTISNKMMLLK